MDFDDSLFDDHSVLSGERKEKKKQYPYSVRRQEFCWFLSDNDSADSTKVIEQLKYKADFLYAQGKCSEAIKCYEQLSPLIPASNTTLMQEVCESRIMCLIILGATEEAATCLDGMIKEDKMNTNLWHLMFTIERDKKNAEKAIFAIQQCLKDNEEVASYWIDLAEAYALHSTCLDWSNDFYNTCQYQEHNVDQENLYKSLFSKSKKNPVGLTCNVEGQQLDKELVWNKYSEIERKEGMILNTKMTNCSIEEFDVTHFEESLMSVKCNELKSYAENHHYCYCALCSLLISRFLLHKYSTRSQLTKQESKHENIFKVNVLIQNITCATDEIVKETRKLLSVKVADGMKLFHSNEFSENMAKNLQEFNNRWFPFK